MSLPPNWEAKVDAATGKTYFFNRVSRVSTWSRPKAEEEDAGLPAPWLKKIDQGSKRAYYFNTKTNETTWQRPGEQALPKNWIVKQDPKTRRTYYFNTSTHESTWDRPSATSAMQPLPPGWVQQTGPDGRVFFYNTVTKASQWERPPPPKLPAGWVAKVDPGSGRTYFVNRATKESRWDLPEAKGAEEDDSDDSDESEEDEAKATTGRRKNRAVIFAESMQANEAYVPRSYPKSEASKTLLRATLKRSFMFSALGSTDLERMVDAFKERKVAVGEAPIRQGDTGDNFYVVESGEFDILINSVGKVATRGPGTSFGEKALLYNCPRAATCQATTEALLWAVDRVTFRHMIANTEESNVTANKSALHVVPLLKSLSDEQFNTLARVVQVVEFKPGDVIIKKGDVGDSFYMVKSGDVVCTGIMAAGKAVADVPLSAGAYFGERALLKDMPRAANVIATSDVTCLVLGREDFANHLGPLMDIIDKDLGLRVLRCIPALGSLSEGQRELVVTRFKTVTYKKGQSVLRAGERSSTFFVVKDGVVKSSDEETFAAGDFFCEDALSRESKVECDFVAVDSVDLFQITKEDFDASMAGVAAEAAKPPPPPEKKVPKRKKPVIRFSDLKQRALLGCGSFGRVTLVEHKPTGVAYALKRLQKHQIVKTKQTANIMREKSLMAKCDHPFILQLIATFQDRDCLYMVLELALGGELFSVLANTEEGVVSESTCLFYSACVLSGLECMHSQNILYRDMKPENMMLDGDGYIKVIDFGFAKEVADRTYTLCGTPEYLAPELVLGKGHGKGVDYWALGILVYEMLCGFTPFADDSGDNMAVCRNICEEELEIPDHLSDEAAALIESLVNRNVNSRLGCMKEGIHDIWAHPFFAKIDWVALVEKELPAPWVPPLKDPFDTSHFEPEDTMKKVRKYKGKKDWCVEFGPYI